jgi:hypothetical protein
MNKQKKVLLLLLGVLVLSLGYAFWRTPKQERVTAPPAHRTPPKSTSAAEAPAAAQSEFRVQLELLERKETKFPGAKRNIFGPLYVVKPPVPPPPPPPPPVAPPPRVEAPAPAMETVRQQLARFTFLGFLEKDREKTIFLASDDDIFVVKKGESLGKNKEYLVTELTAEKLVLQYRDDPRKITVPLLEQAPLTPTMMRMPAMPSSALSESPGRAAPGGFVRRYPGRGLPTPPIPAEDFATEPAEVPADLQQPVTEGEEPPAEEVIQ